MAAARIAAVLLFALAPVAFAQQFPQSIVTVQVNDVTGAPVPGAQVDLTPPCGDPTGGETDGQGGISLDAAPGLWNTILTVTSPGFCPESRTVGILNRPSQIIPIEMQIGGCPSKCMRSCMTVESAEVEKAAHPARSAQGQIVLQAMDMNGGVFQDARVEVDPSLPTPGPVSQTDNQGRAAFDLPGGVHTFVVTESGFKK